jgi:neutral ceramidase
LREALAHLRMITVLVRRNSDRLLLHDVFAQFAGPQPPHCKVPMQEGVHRIGDLAIAAMPFEVFAEIGLELKQHSPIHPLMNISIANGSHGYLPTTKQHRLGGYETWIEHIRSMSVRAKTCSMLFCEG